MFLVLPLLAQAQETVPSVTVDSVRQKIEDGENILLLDVRTEAEYEGSLGHIDSTVLIPIRELPKRLAELEPYRDKEIIVICRTGNRSRTGTILLNKNGFTAVNMTGGMRDWNKQKEDEKKDAPDQ
jgi:rhodanese-related sulfurtransferase